MKLTWLVAAALAASTFVSLPARADDDDDRDDGRCRHGKALRLVNGKIHTMDSKDRVVSSVLMRNGRFLAVGNDARHGDDDCTRTINLRGRTAVPGIIDNHNHIVLMGNRPGFHTPLENAYSIADVQATYAGCAGSAASSSASVGSRTSRNWLKWNPPIVVTNSPAGTPLARAR